MNFKFTTILKLITIGGGLIIVYFIFNLFFKTFYYGHDPDWKIYKEYLWIFKDSVQKDISKYNYSYVRKEDVGTNFRYKGQLFLNNKGQDVFVWDFKEARKIGIDRVKFNHNGTLEDVFFEEYEILDMDTETEIYVNYGFSFRKGFDVNIGKGDTIKSRYQGNGYKGVYGSIREFTLSDKNGEHQILLTNDHDSALTSIVVAEKKNRLFLIVITSDHPFEEDIIEILDLD